MAHERVLRGVPHMARKKTLITTAAAFASTPMGRRLIMQAKEYASRPENQARVRNVIQQAREFASRPENQERIRKLMKSRTTNASASKPPGTGNVPL